MKYKNWLFCSSFVFLLLNPFNLKSQNLPVKHWDKSFGGSDSDVMFDIHKTLDGGYVLGGYSDSGISGDKSQPSKGLRDYWVVKLDSAGNKSWDKTFGGSSSDHLFSLQQTSDAGYILGGTSISGIGGDKSQASQGGIDFWVVKIDSIGNKIWDKTFGGSNSDIFQSLQQTLDGGYILGGESYSGISGDKSQSSRGFNDYWVIKIDANGIKQWDKTFGGNSWDEFQSLKQTSDGGYILGGNSGSGISGDKSVPLKGLNDYWILKLDASGNKIWEKSFGGPVSNGLTDLKLTSDGGYILGGTSNSGIGGDKSQASQGGNDFWVVKIDSIGNKIWDKTFGGSSADFLYKLQQTLDGGYILGGDSESGMSGDKSQPSQGIQDCWIIKIDASGNKLWDRTYGGSSVEFLYSLKETKYGEYILGASSYSGISGDKSQISKGNHDYWVIKLGDPCVAEPVVSPVSNCGSGSVTLSATGAPVGASYAWYNVASGGTPLYTNSSGIFITPNLTTTTTYYVAVISSNGCEGMRVPVTATIHILPTINTGPTVTVCVSAAPLQLSGFSQNGGIWSGPGVSATGVFTPDTSLLGTQTLTYTIIQNGCVVTATKLVTVIPSPVVNAGNSQSICATAPSFQLSGFNPVGGIWSGPGINVGGIFTPDNSLIGTQTLTYSIIQNGCTVSSTKEITVTASPIVLAGSNEIICANASPVQLTGFNPAGGTWSGPGVSASGIFTPHTNLVGSKTLTYSVTQNGCTVSVTKQVTVKPVYEDFLGSDTIVCEGQEITLRVTFPASSYRWNDGSQSSFLKVKQSGDYWVQCALDGCVFTDTIQVTFEKCPELSIPNIITPNTDTKNDFFSPQNLPAGKWQLQVYNRWGVKLFEAENYQNNWPDKKVSNGTYYYHLRNPETGQQFKGWVEVLQ
ncbi:gliding motility-associated C-terminal domain-containing protein [Adhaeribacter sp. BT258]|uniref:Gliding motility-associated C-terminal domain-containing protein n=1 Tax=Adhaeribacter terrigena TaxID=2793070 RepID=A0ABS1BZ11_9BACT|nr:gliding motility-associated C-terminal domain-containing protein [Adhaeribacter terrigena]MBK0401510.1 gliding motility-associated C-terminal domain-containing protein [Adhaeribacter terrigena]